MDEVGLHELVKAGVKVATQKWTMPEAKDAGTFHGTDPEIVTVIDRLAQLGLLALDHEQPHAWRKVVEGLRAVYRLGAHENGHVYNLPERNTWLLIDVVYRVLFLGAVAVRLKTFNEVRTLTLQRPLDNRPDEYWIRYAVTMAAHGHVKSAFKGKSLIGPASECVRERPQFFGAFEENLDQVVNYMCQFDFLHCLVAVAEAKDVWACYPNFGGYYDYRTMPIVLDLIRSGPSRNVVPGLAESELAKILRDLDALVEKRFWEGSGWDQYTPEVYDFISAKLDQG
jgi:hypothetical protein